MDPWIMVDTCITFTPTNACDEEGRVTFFYRTIALVGAALLSEFESTTNVYELVNVYFE